MLDTVSKLLRDYAVSNADRTALLFRDSTGTFTSMSWSTLYDFSRRFGAGLMDLGVKKGDHIGIISDNRKEWIIADLGILSIGCADVPRGSDSTPQEVLYILGHADCAVTLVENEMQMEKILSIKKDLPHLETIIVMDSSLPKPSVKKQG